MKKIIFLLPVNFLFSLLSFSQTVGVGTISPDNSAVLDVQSTSKGMLIPRLTTVQRTGITSPATGLLVFDATTESFWFKSVTNWIELVDTSNNLWKKAGVTAYTSGNTRVGIGTSTASYNLHIVQSNPNIGLTDENTNKVSGTFSGSDGELVINAYRSSTSPGNLILQRSGSVVSQTAGNVGIGIPFTSDPTAKLQVQGGAVLSIAVNDSITGGMFQLGTTTGANIAMDNDEIQTRNNGNTADLNLQKRGGNIVLDNNTKLKRHNSDMLPVCYGVIASNGSIISGTGNFTCSRLSEGTYRIFVNNSGISETTAVTIATPIGVLSNNRFAVINYYTLAYSSVDISLSVDSGGNNDSKFNFIIYRL